MSASKNLTSNTKSDPQQQLMEMLLVKMENFLLPEVSSNRYSFGSFTEPDPRSDLPILRLNNLCYEVIAADHLRSVQEMYRDCHHPDSDVLLEIISHSKGNQSQSSGSNANINVSITNDILLKKNLEGRTKILALSKLCYGSESIESMKADLDLVNAYALLGHWTSVHELLGTLFSKYMHLQSKREFEYNLNEKHRTSKLAAEQLHCFFETLRQHAIANRGQIKKEFGDDLSAAYKALRKSREQVTQTSGDYSFLDDAIGSDDDEDDYDDDQTKEEKKFVASIKIFLQESMNDKLKNNPKTPSWGMVVDFVRSNSPILKKWLDDIDNGLLPQVKAALFLPFRQSDTQRRGVSNPSKFISQLTRFPSSMKLFSSHDNFILSNLPQAKWEVSVIITHTSPNIQSNQTEDISIIDVSLPVDDQQGEKSIVSYELPISWEELLSLYVLYNPEYSSPNHFNDLLKAQLLTLLGVCHIFYDENIADAEESFKQGLKQFELLGLQDSILSCDLYNAIAQLMISKYKMNEKSLKFSCEAKANEWIESIEGSSKLQEAINTLKRSKPGQNKPSLVVNKLQAISHLDTTIRIKNQLLKEKVKELMELESVDMKKSIEASYRYLLKSHEILELYHGQYNIIIATSCIAIASIKNSVKDYMSARDWLSKGLKILSKLDPYENNALPASSEDESFPLRIVAYVQIQLAHVMLRSGHENEGLLLLSKATSFHIKKSLFELKKENRISSESQFTSNPIGKNSPSYDDVQLAMTLTAKQVQLIEKTENKLWEVIELIEPLVQVVERAFGYDSLQAAEQRKHLGVRYAIVGDWTKSINHLRKSVEVYEELYGEESKHFDTASKLLEAAAERKSEVFRSFIDKKVKVNVQNLSDPLSGLDGDKSPPKSPDSKSLMSHK